MTAEDFALAEYTSLRAEILGQQARRDLLLQLTLAAIWLVFVWLATRPATPLASEAVVTALWFLPTVIAALALLKHLAVSRGVRRAAAHLAIRQAGAPGGAGWELRLMRETDDWKVARDQLAMESLTGKDKSGKAATPPKDTDILERILVIRKRRTLMDDLRVEGFPKGGNYPRDVDKVILMVSVVGSLLIGFAGAGPSPVLIVPLVLLGLLVLVVNRLRKGIR